MIKYYFNQDTYEIKVSGHSNYEKFGKDIVCASVSTAIILSVNLLKRLNLENDFDVVVEEGFFHLVVKNLTKTLSSILDNLVWILKELEIQYPKAIKHKE